MTEILTVALPKGRLSDLSVKLLYECGIDCSPLKENTRKLVLFDKSGQYKFILVKPTDVPTYVERGVADVGVSGKDTLSEQQKDVYEVVDLGFGNCRMCVAGYAGSGNRPKSGVLRVATKYERIASEYYESKGINIDLIKLGGSVELGPIVGLSDVIVDVVESGNTLRENGLVVLEEIMPLSARLIINKISYKTKSAAIRPLLDKIIEAVKK